MIKNIQELAFSAVMLHSSVMFISLAASLRKHVIKSELCRKWFSPRDGRPARAVNQRVDGEHSCCFEVSNDRQMAVRANGRGQLGMTGAREEQRRSTQPDSGDATTLRRRCREKRRDGKSNPVANQGQMVPFLYT